MVNRLKDRALELRKDAYILYLASKDKRVPWYAKALAASVIAYLLSPIDLIPDFIPVIGYLDDIIIVPAGIALTIKLIPVDVLEDLKRKADTKISWVKSRWITAGIIAVIWLIIIFYLVKAVISAF